MQLVIEPTIFLCSDLFCSTKKTALTVYEVIRSVNYVVFVSIISVIIMYVVSVIIMCVVDLLEVSEY